MLSPRPGRPPHPAAAAGSPRCSLPQSLGVALRVTKICLHLTVNLLESIFSFWNVTVALSGADVMFEANNVSKENALKSQCTSRKVRALRATFWSCWGIAVPITRSSRFRALGSAQPHLLAVSVGSTSQRQTNPVVTSSHGFLFWFVLVKQHSQASSARLCSLRAVDEN